MLHLTPPLPPPLLSFSLTLLGWAGGSAPKGSSKKVYVNMYMFMCVARSFVSTCTFLVFFPGKITTRICLNIARCLYSDISLLYIYVGLLGMYAEKCDSRHVWRVTYLYDYPHLMSHTWHDRFISLTRLIHTCDATWLIYVCDMTHLCVWHDSCMCVWHDSCMCVTRLS